jgi:hypothetical protein
MNNLMSAEFFGGPLDGAISSTVPSHMPEFLVASNLPESPVYKRRCCAGCASTRCGKVPYCFVGYGSGEESEKTTESSDLSNRRERA